ncbi:MAG: hypothetical protein M3P85_11090 [Actinomycetota bacterium]|nr:hypothetical protein [Actinomycetota bacterium]
MADYATRLAAARGFVAALKERGEPDLPTHLTDQLGAASAEAHHRLYALRATMAVVSPDRAWRKSVDLDLDEARARMLAALADLRPCPHLRRPQSPRPALALLALRLLVCDRCAATVRNPPPDEADRCDVCGKREVEVFTPLGLQVGPMVLIGDACGDCATGLRLSEAS